MTLASAVAQGISVGSWKTKPRSRCGLPDASWLVVGHSIVPEDGAPSPATMRSKVDLPQPDGPSRLMNSPVPRWRLTSRTASVPLANCFETCRTETSGLASLRGAWGVLR